VNAFKATFEERVAAEAARIHTAKREGYSRLAGRLADFSEKLSVCLALYKFALSGQMPLSSKEIGDAVGQAR
jgi:hypothetical protein